jgi:hypothetical protein
LGARALIRDLESLNSVSVEKTGVDLLPDKLLTD